MISYSSLLFSLAALAAIGWLGWISVQSYLQGARLCALPRSGGAVIEGETLAARGKVKVLVPLAVPGAFPCLWYRERVQEARSWLWRNRWDSDSWRTVSDYVRMATFAVVVDGEEIEVDALPTEVQCTQTTVDREDRGLLASLLGELGSRRRCEWLPVREEITVIGRLERRGERRVLVEDPALGLLLSPHPPDEAGNIETLKAIAGFVGVLLGGTVSVWAFLRALGVV